VLRFKKAYISLTHFNPMTHNPKQKLKNLENFTDVTTPKNLEF